MKPHLTYYLLRGSVSFFYNMWLTVMLLYHTTWITEDPFLLIVLGAVHEATVFLLEVPTGVLADAYSRKLSVIIGLILTGIAFTLEGSFAIYGTVLIAQIIYAIGFTFYSGANDAWLADEVGPEHAGPVYVRGSQIGLIAGQLGILGAIIIGQNVLYLPLQVAGIGTLLIGIACLFIMNEDGFQPEHSSLNITKKFLATFRKSTNLLQRRSGFWVVVLVGSIVGASVGGYDRLFTPHFLLNFDPPFKPVIWFGILSLIISLTSAVILQSIRNRAQMISAEGVPYLIALLYSGSIIGNVIFVVTGDFWLAVEAFWFSQMLRTTTRPLIIIWINQITTSPVRATAISMYWQSNALGHVIGLPIIGLIERITSLQFALLLSVLALSPTVWLLTQSRFHPTQKASVESAYDE